MSERSRPPTQSIFDLYSRPVVKSERPEAPGKTIEVNMANPHFVDTPFLKPVSVTGEAVVVFNEGGLGNNVSIEYTLSARATSIFACKNNGGKKFPKDPIKQTISKDIYSFDSFSSGSNGHVDGEMRLDKLELDLPLDCPKGQHKVLVSAKFDKIVIEDMTNQVVYNFPGPVEMIYYKF